MSYGEKPHAGERKEHQMKNKKQTKKTMPAKTKTYGMKKTAAAKGAMPPKKKMK